MRKIFTTTALLVVVTVASLTLHTAGISEAAGPPKKDDVVDKAVAPLREIVKAIDEAKVNELIGKMAEAKMKAAQRVAQHLQDISVTIVAKNRLGSGEGSGVIKTRRTSDGDTVNFVWTAAHVVEHLRKTRTVIDSKSGTPKVVVEFDDALIVKANVENGRKVGKIEFDAEVIRYNAEEDLALLRVRKKNLVKCSVQVYYKDKEIPPISTELLHVGSLLGQLGSNSMTKGIMSQHGRLIDRKVFDQTTVTAFPGSSGGGVYLTDGRLVGLVLRGAGETFNLIVPSRRMKDWAKKAQVEWAFDDKVAMPTEEELQKLPVEDTGVQFSYSVRADREKKGLTFGKYKVMIIKRGEGFQLGTFGNEINFPTYLHYVPNETTDLSTGFIGLP
jgi:S1-C subfamily serine protease